MNGDALQYYQDNPDKWEAYKKRRAQKEARKCNKKSKKRTHSVQRTEVTVRTKSKAKSFWAKLFG